MFSLNKKRMKQLKFIYLLLISITISCGSDDSEAPQELNLSDLVLTISNIERTSANIEYSGNIVGETVEVLFKERNSNENFQSVPIQNSQLELTSLTGATEYELKIQSSNSVSNVQSNSYYFITKSVDLDYSKFYSSYSWYNNEYYSPYEFFSHLNRSHVIHGEGLSEFDDIKAYLVNEQKTDSLELNISVISDSLSFVIPNDYLTQSPRESFKKAYVGIKIKDSYQYILNQSTWVNLTQNPDFNADEPNLKFKIFNDKPFISSVILTTGFSSSCSNYTNINLVGEFFGVWDFYYWTAEQAEIFIYDSDNNLFGSYINSGNSSCNDFSLGLHNPIEDGLLSYHQRKSAQLARLSDLPTGNYTAKIVFTFENGNDVETNTIDFVKN